MTLRRFDPAEDALLFAAGVVDDDLDRVDALGDTASGRAPTAQELGQLGAQAVIERLVESQAVEEGSYRWRGELRLWVNEALMGWYRSTEGIVPSKGTMYLILDPHGTHAWGRWVGMSYDGPIISGWGAMARTDDQARQIVQDVIDTTEASDGTDR